MLQNAPTKILPLLMPVDLPIEHKLSEAEQKKVSKAMELFLQALGLSSAQEAINTIDNALEILGLENVLLNPINLTHCPLKTWEIEDYNKYFNVVHIQSHELAIALMRSILVAYRTFLELNQQENSLELSYVEIQKQGFKSYAYLLARVFHLNLEEVCSE